MTKRSTMKSLVRCATSRYICFPLIFTITTISMMATVLQHSYVKSSLKVDVKREIIQQTNSASAESESLVTKWEYTTPSTIPSHGGNAALVPLRDMNIDSLPNPKLPHLPTIEKTKHGKVTKGGSKSTIGHAKFQRNQVNFHGINRGIPKALSEIAEKMSEAKNTKPNMKGVLIVTNYRSGSTFLGQLFNQHPDAFYTFEPLFPFGSNCSFELQRRIRTMHEMMKCNFPNMGRLYRELHKDPSKTGTHKSCVSNNFCFRYNHKDLCDHDTCPHGNKDTCMGCGPVDLRSVKYKCRSRQVVAIKLIRLCYIEEYRSLFEDANLDLKVIHLVRDPRGISSSRLKIHPDWDIVENIRSTCQRQVMNLKAGRNEDWLANRYKLIRYEDLALNPLELAAEIYDFVGLPLTDGVREWIGQNTQLKVKAKANIREKLLGRKMNGTYQAVADPYATQRDSKAAMQAWRNHISPAVTDDIQKHCYESLRSLGYYDFKTIKEQLNMNISSIL